MAYLTSYSFNRLVEMTEINNIDKIDSQFFTANIFDNQYLFYFFNQFELKKLFRAKLLLSDDKDYVLTYNDVPSRVDNYSFILPVKGKVKYHIKSDCKALNRGFKNFFMPETIVTLKDTDSEKHQKIVEEIRNWFSQNNYTIQRYESLEITSLEITKKFNSYFPKQYSIAPIIITDKLENNFQWYISKKTDIQELNQEFDYNKFIDKIIMLITKRHKLCDTLERESLSRFDYMLKKENDEIIREIDVGILKNLSFCIEKMGIIKLKKFWAAHIVLKNEAKKLLEENFKWTYNFKEKEFDAIYLENFNLAKCLVCSNV